MHTLREGEVVTLRPGQKVRVDYLEGDDWVIAPGPETLTPYGGNDHEELIAVTNRHDGFVMVPTRLVMVRAYRRSRRGTPTALSTTCCTSGSATLGASARPVPAPSMPELK